MNSVIEAAFARAGAVILSLLVLSVVGISSYFEIPKEAAPDVDIPVTYVSVSYEGISPEDSERLLVKPLEKHLRSVEGLDKRLSNDLSLRGTSLLVALPFSFCNLFVQKHK